LLSPFFVLLDSFCHAKSRWAIAGDFKDTIAISPTAALGERKITLVLVAIPRYSSQIPINYPGLTAPLHPSLTSKAWTTMRNN